MLCFCWLFRYHYFAHFTVENPEEQKDKYFSEDT